MPFKGKRGCSTAEGFPYADQVDGGCCDLWILMICEYMSRQGAHGLQSVPPGVLCHQARIFVYKISALTHSTKGDGLRPVIG